MKKKAKKKIKNQNNSIISDEEFVSVLNKVTKKLIYKFKFGYHEVEDMKQQAAIFALEALEKYDHKRPLENFLWTHIRNRLFNFKRDKYQRPDKPCLTCPLYDPKLKCSSSGCSKYSNKLDCDLYNTWMSRNERKKNLNQLTSISQNYDLSSSLDLINDASNKEIVDLLDEHLSYKYREIFLKIRHGEKVSSAEIKKFSVEAEKILKLNRERKE
jgi:DNA-directed RNA polymerase specialized sigma24 family protein